MSEEPWEVVQQSEGWWFVRRTCDGDKLYLCTDGRVRDHLDWLVCPLAMDFASEAAAREAIAKREEQQKP